MISFKIGKIKKIIFEDNEIINYEIKIDGQIYKSLAIKKFLPETLKVKDKVIVNSTAIDLDLGTGGYQIVICKYAGGKTKINSNVLSREKGHIIKLRYTPLQLATFCVEDEKNPLQKKIKSFKSLNNLPVIMCFLHSQIAGVVFALKHLTKKKIKIAYIMNDTAALPLYLSKLVKSLKEKNLIDWTITCGQAFGGDYETINFYTALICGKEICKADVIIASQGFGNVGSNTPFGFSAICVGEMINAVGILKGNCIVVPRISFADKRKRHQGISYHTLTVLNKIALKPATIVFPKIATIKQDYINRQIKENLLNRKHKIVTVNSLKLLSQFIQSQIRVKTMYRGILEDEEFFLSCLAAGMFANNLLKL